MNLFPERRLYKMEERKFIKLKKEEYGIKEFIKRDLGKGKISKLDIEYTPVGEKIIISTSKPGLVIGRRGEKIEELTGFLKKRFKLENPHIEIKEIENPLFDSQLVADEIAMALERMGNLKFKVIAYRKLQEIMRVGALGCEMRLTGKLPSERAKSWRFAEGYLKKAGEPSKEIDRAQATALTKTGIIGVKVAIMPPDAKIYDKIDINDEMKKRINSIGAEGISEKVEEKTKKVKVKGKKVEDTAVEAGKVAKIEEEKVKENKEGVSEEKIDAAGLKEGDVVKETMEVKPEEDGTAIEIKKSVEDGINEVDEKAIEKVEKSEKVEDKENINKDEKLIKEEGK